MHGKRVNVLTVLAGQRLGFKEVDEGIWIASFMRYDLGFIDLEQNVCLIVDACHIVVEGDLSLLSAALERVALPGTIDQHVAHRQ